MIRITECSTSIWPMNTDDTNRICCASLVNELESNEWNDRPRELKKKYLAQKAKQMFRERYDDAQ